MPAKNERLSLSRGPRRASRTDRPKMPDKKAALKAGKLISIRGRARAQSQKRRPRPAARQSDRDDRPVGLGKILARLRHDLRRGAAPLRRVALRLRAAVSGNDAEAGRRPDRRALAGDLDRAEDDVAQPALHRRHRHRDLRLHAPALRARRHPLFAGDRAADREPDRLADGRPHSGAAGGHAALSARAGRARPKRRIPKRPRRLFEEGLSARKNRRKVLRDRRGPCPRQEAEARHRHRGRPRRRARRHQDAPGGFSGDGAENRRRPGGRRARRQAAPGPIRSPAGIRQQIEERDARAHHLFGKIRLPRLRLHHLGDRAAALLLQQSLRRLPGMRRARHQAGDRPGARRPRREGHFEGRRHRALVENLLALLSADARRPRAPFFLQAHRPLFRSPEARAGRHPLRHGRGKNRLRL